MLVTAVLGPEQREDRELEVIRVPAEQVADSLELAVRQPEGAMKRLFRYRRQIPESSRLTGRVGGSFYAAMRNFGSTGRPGRARSRRPDGQSPYGLLIDIASDALSP